jgi:hypothetical protein
MLYVSQQHVEEEENILQMVLPIPPREDFLHISVFHKHVCRTLHDDGLYPFHPQLLRNLHPGYIAMRLEFCRWLHSNRQLLPLRLFADEATFTRNGVNSTRNSHRWCHDNPHSTVETNFQRRLSINVWCGVIDILTGPVIEDDRMTGHNYIDFLQNGLAELEDVPLATWIAMYFQHDGALSH